ncbi:MAG: hypothetical protein AAF419_03120 [Pseudomonadota bacterium]
MSLRINTQIYNAARNYYSEALNYHNFQHVLETFTEAKKLLALCDKNSISYDKKIIYHSILFHDAGFEKNHIQKGFESKESYSAYLAKNILTDAGESNNHITAVERAILCTRMNAICHSNNENIVRAADLSGLAANYDYFKKKSKDLYREREFMTGEIITWQKFKDETYQIIRGFLQSKIKLDIELFKHDNYLFKTKVFYNLNRLMNDTFD